jgi:hypothetical protein
MPALAKGSIILSKPEVPRSSTARRSCLWAGRNGFGIGVADVAPEEQAAMKRRELVVNLLEEVDVDGAVAAVFYLLRGAALAEVKVSSAPM